MKFEDIAFLKEVMPTKQWRDLSSAVLNLEFAYAEFEIEAEEAVEKLTKASRDITAAEAVVNIKKIQYGVGS